MTAIQPNSSSDNAPRPALSVRIAVRRAFTLIELLVVIALTAVLFTLVFAPLINSLDLTSRAATQIEAQGSARDLERRLEAELSGPVYVYDNASQGLNNPKGKLGDPDGRVTCWINTKYQPLSGTAAVDLVRFGLIEFIAPGSQSEQSNSTTVDPTTGRTIPTPGAPTNVALPLTPGRNIVRYFMGLQDNTSAPTSITDPNGFTYSGQPVKLYASKFDDASDVATRLDNRTTLYRAEVQPYIQYPLGSGTYIPNVALFHTIVNGNKTGDSNTQSSTTGTLLLDDPNFFYDTTPVPTAIALIGAPGVQPAGRATIPMWECWKAVAQTMLNTPKADAISLERDSTNAVVLRDASGQISNAGLPVVRPLISFTPQYVENDPGVPSSLSNTGAETPYAAATQFRAQYPALCRPFRVLVYRSPDGQQDPLSLTNPIYYEMDDPNGGILAQNAGGNVGPMPDAGGFWSNTNPQLAFTVDYDRGLVNFAFPHWALFNTVVAANKEPVPQRYDPADVNAQIDQTYGKRFLWLRNFPINTTNYTGLNPATAISPIGQYYLDPTANGCSASAGVLPPQAGVRVVPGSETVYGPDQISGFHYGWRTQYTRVSSSAGRIGPNQYRILYENGPNADCLNDANDPRVQTGYIEFDSQPDTDAKGVQVVGVSPSANLAPGLELPWHGPGQEPVYRTHSLPQRKWDQTSQSIVNSDPVEVSYSFQMNRPTDVVKIDYLTRSIINVNMELRLYDPRSGRPQTAQLATKISVRNLQR